MNIDLKALVPEWIRSLTAYPPGKPIEELEREYGIFDSIKLASNENPLGPSPKAVAAITAALSNLHRYPDGNCFYLKRALAKKLGVSPDALIFGNGSNEIIELAVRTFLQRGDEAVMADQAFVIYRLVTQSVGATGKLVPLRHFTHDLEAIAEAITPATRMVFLANPNNPTGTIFFRREWEEFLAAVPPHVIVVMDEAYFEFVDDKEYPDSLAAHSRNRLLITLRTFSKIYGLAGLRIGFGVADPVLIEVMNRVRAPFNVSSLAQTAALAALDDDEHVERTRRCNLEGVAYLRAELDRLKIEYVPSWANFILVDVGNGVKVYEALLRQGVIVRPLGVYGFPEHVRVSIGTKAENERFVAALKSVLHRGGASAAAF
ncbi:MAG TPA: histidinol-phosphate transaminase [Candidatus Acidoferrales bacterium]|nr:histidinol-phosphate transaminase [Candidatus Acidoferrales bacterium]